MVTKCPGCSEVYDFPGWKVTLHKCFSVRGVFPEFYCRCGNYWYTRTFVGLSEANPRVGRPRLGKTHVRSAAAKAERLQKRNKRRKASKKVHWTSSIKDGKLCKTKHRPGKPDINVYTDVPGPVAQAIRNLLSLPAVKPVRKPKRVIRTPRKRTRSEQIERLQRLLEQTDTMNDIQRWNRINARLEEEYLLQARRDVHENLDRKFIWSDTPEELYIERARERAKDGRTREHMKRFGIVFDT